MRGYVQSAITGKWHRIIATTAMIRVRTSTRSEEEMIDALTTFNCERFGMDLKAHTLGLQRICLLRNAPFYIHIFCPTSRP